MTNPGGAGSSSNFEYTDDSVVARLSFDVPPQALTDVVQLTQALSAMATQQDYIARSTGSWLDYMQQIPQIMERANQSYREAITQMERMSYLQGEMGGHGVGGVSGPQAGGPGGYSTAAPAGYQMPFTNPYGMGMTPDLINAQQHMAGMASQDPRMYANYMGSRGQAVNPALLGMVGGTAAGQTGQGGVGGNGGGMGYGNASPGSLSSQGTQANRDSSAPPDPRQSGQPTTSEAQNLPAEPHPDSPGWQQTVASTINGAQQLMNETKAGGGGGRNAANMLGMASAGMAAAGKWAANNPDAMGGMSGRLGSIAKGAGLAGIGAWGLSKANDVGEQIQQYNQIGSVQGGGAMQGMGYEAQARLLALNPFITTEQARQAMQMALSQGFRGGDFDTVQDYMLSNFKDMGVQFSTSMELAKAGIQGGQNATDAAGGGSDLLKEMYRLSRDGGAAFPERQQQAVSMMDQLTSQGMSPEAAQRSVLASQEGYADNKQLFDNVPGSIQGAMGNSTFLANAMYKHGITGALPGTELAHLSAAGYDSQQLYDDAAKEYAQRAAAQYPKDQINAVGSFMGMMNQMGASLDFATAEPLYKKALGLEGGGEDAQKQANQRIANAPHQGFGDVALDLIKAPFRAVGNVWDAAGDAIKGDWSAAYADVNRDPRADVHDAQKTADKFAAAGRGPAAIPTTPEQAAAQTPVRTEGQVTGQLAITVDQNGKVTAPQQIQLSGTQRSANAGYGSAQLNNAPPGEGYQAFPGGI